MQLRQNFLRVYENDAGTVTILTNEDADSSQQITIQSIIIQIDDLRSVARALLAIADEIIGDE
jgi:hypothetical protein